MQSDSINKIHAKIWIDLDNSPHVWFFRPIVSELQKLGVEILVTARDCFQVCDLAEKLHYQYHKIGKHYGKNKILKLVGIMIRSVELAPLVIKFKPILALSHGSRAQILLAHNLRIPYILMADYEYAQWLPLTYPKAVVVPEVVAKSFNKKFQGRIFTYPGIKENVYIGNFRPDFKEIRKLNLFTNRLIATMRPPATEAHYHNSKSEKLFEATVEYLGKSNKVQMVILPRNNKQRKIIENKWPSWCKNGTIKMPKEIVNGLNLIWHSDFVISGGGTMNREAAVLGVPVYSIFTGNIGAVDRYLAKQGRLKILKTVYDIHNNIKLLHRDRWIRSDESHAQTLYSIINIIRNCS